MPTLAPRLERIQASPIMGMVQLTAQLKQAGKPVLDLGIGEPDFDTPDHIKEAGIEAIRDGQTGYTPVNGTLKLREAIVRKFSRENNLDYRADAISVGCGGKQVIFNAIMATVGPGDEVVIPSPYWTSYPDMVLLAEGVPVIVPTQEQHGFRLAPEQLEAAISSKTKWVILNSPSNPTGAAYSPDELDALAAVLRRHPQLWILSDEIYEHLVYDGLPFRSFAHIAPDLFERTLTMNGVSKAYAMTGWRLGFAGGPLPLIKAMSMVQGHSTTHTASISQAAAMAALDGSQDSVRERRDIFEARRNLVVAALRAIPGLTCAIPQGAFYVYPGIAGLIGKRTPSGQVIDSDEAFARYLLEEHYVSTVHGAAFGLSPYIRLSYAAASEVLTAACERIRQACEALK